MSYIDIIAIVIFIVFMSAKFVSDYHRLFKPWKEQKINQVKEWNRQRNNRTRELKKQIKDWNNRRNNKTRELIKKIKDWNNRRNQKLRAWKEWGREQFKNFKAWWKKDVLPEWEKATSFKRIYIVFSCIIGVILSILFLALCLQIIVTLLGLSNIDEIDSNFALAFLGTVSGGVALFTGYIAILRSETNTQQNEIANRQAITAEEGLITDRINKAVESLGRNDDGKRLIQVRVGALYALERIAQDSIRDHVRIIKILCAYIRNTSSNDGESDKIEWIRDDIRTIQIIISGRDQWSEYNRRLEMEAADVKTFDFFNCHLEGAEFQTANLYRANFNKANLKNAWLNHANIGEARLENAILDGVQFAEAKTNMAYAIHVDFSKCDTLTQEQLDVMYCGIPAKIPSNLTRPKHWPTVNLSYAEFMKSYYKWRRTQL